MAWAAGRSHNNAPPSQSFLLPSLEPLLVFRGFAEFAGFRVIEPTTRYAAELLLNGRKKLNGLLKPLASQRYAELQPIGLPECRLLFQGLICSALRFGESA